MEKQKTHPVLSVKDVLMLVVGALLLIVIFQNFKAHQFRILFWKPWISPMLIILVMAGAGFLAGFLVGRRRVKSRADKAAAQAAPPPSPKPPTPGNPPLA